MKQDPWYIVYHSPNFSKLNHLYKPGITIAKLKTVKSNKESGYKFDKIFSSPNNPNSEIFDGVFWSGTAYGTQILEDDEKKVIKLIFTKFKPFENRLN